MGRDDECHGGCVPGDGRVAREEDVRLICYRNRSDIQGKRVETEALKGDKVESAVAESWLGEELSSAAAAGADPQGDRC